jgi:hypothetical protein
MKQNSYCKAEYRKPELGKRLEKTIKEYRLENNRNAHELIFNIAKLGYSHDKKIKDICESDYLDKSLNPLFNTYLDYLVEHQEKIQRATYLIADLKLSIDSNFTVNPNSSLDSVSSMNSEYRDLEKEEAKKSQKAVEEVTTKPKSFALYDLLKNKISHFKQYSKKPISLKPLESN